MDKESQNLDFLQSEEWQKFQEAVGKKTHIFSYPQPGPFSAGGGDFDFRASIIEHKLPLVGRYFYVPRGPIIRAVSDKRQVASFLNKLTDLARKEKAGWIRFDANNDEKLNFVRSNLRGGQISKAPHDMQPRETFMIGIAKAEEELLAEMKAKTRYNIKLSQKLGVSVKVISNKIQNSNDKNLKYYVDKFLRLVRTTSERQGITPHAENYYRQMFETIPPEIIKLYIAEYQGKVIAANIMIFYGDTAIYLHGASDNEYRNVMAPYLLQWRAIQDAKKAGCAKYDFGGIKSHSANRITQSEKNDTLYTIRDTSSWAGITKFKTGFSPNTQPTEFSGSYDIVLNPCKYNLYRILQKLKSFK